MSNAKLLVVDDEPQIRRVMRTALTSHAYEIVEARNGEEALEMMQAERPDLVILDVNMPGMGGLEACREIRRQSDVSIVMLTVRNTERDKVRALDAGADDYVVKPFGMEELLARIRAALRRTHAAQAVGPVDTPDLRIDFETRKVFVRNEPVRLTPKEFELLRQLAASAGKPVPHRRLLQAVWGPEYGEESEYLRVFINQLRKKIEPDPRHPRYIITEPWLGYRFELPPSPAPSRPSRSKERRADGTDTPGPAPGSTRAR
jgi:two-component system, OmpR family, KDP operon response regulator KdpE